MAQLHTGSHPSSRRAQRIYAMITVVWHTLPRSSGSLPESGRLDIGGVRRTWKKMIHGVILRTFETPPVDSFPIIPAMTFFPSGPPSPPTAMMAAKPRANRFRWKPPFKTAERTHFLSNTSNRCTNFFIEQAVPTNMLLFLRGLDPFSREMGGEGGRAANQEPRP